MLPREFRLSSGNPVLEFDSLDSTNSEAMRRVEAGETGPLWIVAGRQSAGKGRAGRMWSSKPGNLYATLIRRLSVATGLAPQLSLVAGVASIDAVRTAMPAFPGLLRLKWPNDILIGAEKVGGILVESSTDQEGLLAAVGIGVNLESHPEGLDQPATHLGAHGVAPSPEALLETLSAALDEWITRWEAEQGFGAVRDAWLGRAGPVGEQMRINTAREAVTGTFRGLDETGALLLRDQVGRVRRFSFGDVSLGG
jgi:BirA family biotin operon repressor/biotin-[acetyl-CoA-carboxylase] ligase